MLLRALLSFAVLAFGFSTAHADSYVYSVMNNFPNFSVSGTITTDSNVGVLSQADITDFTLTLTSSTGTDVLNSANADNVGLYGYGLTATADGLYFDYDTPDTIFFFQNNSAGTSLCYQTSGCVTGAPSGEYVDINGVMQSQAQSGVQQIASLAPLTVTPEPSSLLLLGTGVLMTLPYVRRHVAR